MVVVGFRGGKVPFSVGFCWSLLVLDGQAVGLVGILKPTKIGVVSRDSVRGFKLLREAAVKGSARAVLLLSYLYSYDIDNAVVDKDYAKANELLEIAANHGVVHALYYLGEYYLDGTHGIRKNEPEADY